MMSTKIEFWSEGYNKYSGDDIYKWDSDECLLAVAQADIPQLKVEVIHNEHELKHDNDGKLVMEYWDVLCVANCGRVIYDDEDATENEKVFRVWDFL